MITSRRRHKTVPIDYLLAALAISFALHVLYFPAQDLAHLKSYRWVAFPYLLAAGIFVIGILQVYSAYFEKACLRKVGALFAAGIWLTLMIRVFVAYPQAPVSALFLIFALFNAAIFVLGR